MAIRLTRNTVAELVETWPFDRLRAREIALRQLVKPYWGA
jgi:hypothetical protein